MTFVYHICYFLSLIIEESFYIILCWCIFMMILVDIISLLKMFTYFSVTVFSP